jgi:GAF domain-containing protein
VLEVLDRPEQSRFSLEEMELLGLFANQAAISLDLLSRARRARAVLEEGDADAAALARLAARLDALEGSKRKAGMELLTALETLFK